MTDQQDRERESQQSSQTKFDEAAEAEQEERDRLAKRVEDEPALEERAAD